MKRIKHVLYIGAFLLLMAGCDKNFEEINTNPIDINDIDLGLVFAGSQRVNVGDWEGEHTIVQHFVVPFNDGATLGFNFNEDINNQQLNSFNQYTGAIRIFVHMLNRLEGTTDQVNLQSITRIWKAYVMMDIVDHYGDVPYFNAGRASEGAYFYPEYDDDAAIYEDLYAEITEALSNLDPTGDFVSADLFFGKHGSNATTTAAAQVAKWNKLGNSLLLRLGMRYSKLNPTKAESIVDEAFTGGVMESNADNAYVFYDGTLYTNTANNNLINNNPKFYYAADTFVSHLKATADPRAKFIFAMYDNPNNPLGDADPDTELANQFGVPVGVNIADLALPPYRGPKGTGGFDYSQMNVSAVASISAPTFWLTYAQTSLLLAEAAHRGWIAGGETAAQTYYENGIKADMDIMAEYKARTGSTLPAITPAEQDDYLAQTGVAYDAANALEQINTQYWIVCIRNGAEAFANIRRSGFPALKKNTYNNFLEVDGGDGYVHRYSYPDAETSANKDNYFAAVARIEGGVDNITARVFWDIP